MIHPLANLETTKVLHLAIIVILVMGIGYIVEKNAYGCTGFCIARSSLESHLSPLKQFNSGIMAKNVTCANSLVLVIKTDDGSPACVKSTTAQKLVERGWAKEAVTNPSKMKNLTVNPLGVAALVTYAPPDACMGMACPPFTFYLKINSNYTAYLLGYDICGPDLCVNNETLSIMLPKNSIQMPIYASIPLSENKKWNYGDTVNLHLKISPSQDNKTAYLLDFKNSTIVP